jgi:hypothetical protein
MENTFNGNVNFGQKIVCLISHNADLMWKSYLQVDVSAMTASSGTIAWTKNLGYSMIDRVEFEIGGQIIDTHTGDYLNIMKELSTPVGHKDTLNKMIGNVTSMTDNTSPSSTSTPAYRLYVPLHFYFCNHTSKALPLVALPYQDVKVNVYFKAASQLYIGTPVATPTITACSLYVDYIYVDIPERNKITSQELTYLIDQVQYSGGESVSATTFRSRLAFNHPCYDLLWVVQPDANISVNDWTNFTNSGNDTVVDAKLQLNNQDKFPIRTGDYFNLVQPYQHYTNGPSTGIYAYSFAFHPENQVQPSGSVNFSKIDNSTLLLTLSSSAASQLKVFARNKNILKIRNGLGGISFAS